VARRDLVAERLADLRDPERGLAAGELRDVLEVDEDPLGGLGPEEHALTCLLDRPDARLEHQIELARLGEIAVRGLAWPLAGLAPALFLSEVVGTEALLAGAAVDEWIGEPRDVARRLPDLRVEDDRGVEGDDVVALLHHRLEPACLHVLLEEDAVVAVVVRRAEPTVDLRRRKDETAPARERDDLVHGDLGHGATLPSPAWQGRA